MPVKSAVAFILECRGNQSQSTVRDALMTEVVCACVCAYVGVVCV